MLSGMARLLADHTLNTLLEQEKPDPKLEELVVELTHNAERFDTTVAATFSALARVVQEMTKLLETVSESDLLMAHVAADELEKQWNELPE